MPSLEMQVQSAEEGMRADTIKAMIQNLSKA